MRSFLSSGLRFSIAAGIAFVLSSALPAMGQTTHKAPHPTKETDAKSCTTPECHPEVKAYKFVHGPVNVDACNACHKLTDAAAHKFQDTRPKEQSCTFCHKMDIPAGATVHAPVKTGDCLGCHNPHGGKTARFTRGDTMRQTCDKCHQDIVGKKTHVHGPVAAGVCESCHSPHFSKFPKLLTIAPRDLCLSCHKDMGDKLHAAKVTHKPVVDGDCSQCHDAHASNYNMQVKTDPFTLCTSCHEHDKIKQTAMNAKYKHEPVTKDQACLNCHTPHGGPLANLMKAQTIDICLQCHKDPQKTPDGRAVASVAQMGDARLFKHGPVQEGTCSGCHNPHGSDVQRILAKPYPATFYAKFDPDNFALCFSCHDKKLVETKEAQGLTGFRNGTQNLHFVHVDKEKGRTCRACHETHASQSTLLIREAVPFGQWELPVNYKKTTHGGSCAPGCHKEYAYDREKPVENNPAPGSTLPAGIAPAAPAGAGSAGTTARSGSAVPAPVAAAADEKAGAASAGPRTLALPQ